MNLGETIYRLRTERNMSQGALADMLGVSRQSISKWENNNAIPELDKLVKMAELFGVTLDELVTGKSPEKSEPINTHPVRFTRQQTVGIVFFCMAAFLFLYMALNRQAADGLLMVLPFGLCGVLCFCKLRHTALWCSWVFGLPLVFTPFVAVMRISIAKILIPAIYLPLFCATVWCLRKDPVKWNRWTALFLILGYTVCFAWLLNDIFRFVEILYFYGIFAHWIRAFVFLVFTSVISISTRLLKEYKSQQS